MIKMILVSNKNKMINPIKKFTNMKSLKITSVLLGLLLVFTNAIWAQDDTWPKTINTQDGSILKIYQPTPESFTGNILKTRSAISLLSPDSTEPVFGTFWAVRTVETDRDNRVINVVSVKVPNVKFASNVDANTIGYIKTALETQIPTVEPTLSQDAILASLETNTEEKKLSKGLENNPPKIIYSNKPSILVVIDGEPKLKHNDSWGLDAVVNTPFTIVKNTDGNYYLYGGKHWYRGSSASGPFDYTTNVPNNLSKVQSAVDNANNSDPGFSSDSASAQPNTIPDVIVSTIPAELIQTNGPPSLTNIDGTSLSYISNSQNDIFLSQADQQYYVLLSGRWYKSPDLNGSWQYTAANNLPSDFAKIPAGSPKDNVLASVAGTTEAKEAVMDAQIPQTAKVDRKNATTDVTYDGNPDFQPITGTDMQYAVNSPSSVIFSHGRYYCVDKGVWFESGQPSGPWAVCVDRPDDVDLIPPSYPVYNMKYVYIYDVDPDWVYMGYTPGYLNTFIYGPTIVYGTGYYYRPWRGRYFYPRPYTWGFSMYYNPWFGWGFGYNYGYNWFNVGFGASAWPYWRGGWWGPSIYRPPYRINPYRSYGYYGYYRPGIGGRPGLAGRPALGNNSIRVNNIYNFRRDVVTNNNRYNAGGNRFNGNGRLNGRPAVSNNTVNNNRAQRPSESNNNIATDREGNVYQRNNSQWQQRSQRQWQPVDNSRNETLNRQQQMRDRGQQRAQSFQSTRQNMGNYNRSGGGNSGGGRSSGGGGGGRSSGGGGGGRGGGRH
jgi:uncharacterized membrane protein YgcG